jgi:hypothetical protein
MGDDEIPPIFSGIGSDDGEAPSISARLYDMDVTVEGASGDSLDEVQEAFIEEWRRVLADYERVSDVDSTLGVQ